jgi:hypothetical protein
MLFFCYSVKATESPVKLSPGFSPLARQGGDCREARLIPKQAKQNEKHECQPNQELHGVKKEGFHV